MANIYEKLATARQAFKQMNIKQSGKNEYANFTYFELGDILPVTTELELKHKFISVVNFEEDVATLTVIDVEKPTDTIVFSSPMSKASLKGCHEVQNLGAVQTYIKRYLYQNAYEIVENDALDGSLRKDKGTNNKPTDEPKKELAGEELLDIAMNTTVTMKSGEKVKLKDLAIEPLQAVSKLEDNPELADRAKRVLMSKLK